MTTHAQLTLSLSHYLPRRWPYAVIDLLIVVTVDSVRCTAAGKVTADLSESNDRLKVKVKAWVLAIALLTLVDSNSSALVYNLVDAVVKKGKDVDLYSAFHAPGTPNAHVTETGPPDRYF